MKRIKTIIIDDEAKSRKTLHDFLSKYCPDVEIIAEGASVREAVKIIELHKPELVFLDINMPEGNGFELFRKIKEPDFYTVFVTAYDQYAIEAFRHQAVDYILKPINIAELIKTINRIKTLHSYKTNTNQLNAFLQATTKKAITSDKIALPVADGLTYVQTDDIIHCEAQGNYTCFHFTNRSKLLVSRTLGFYEDLLKSRGFIRIHHQHLINLMHVEKYQRGRGGTVIMADKTELMVSQRRKEEFIKMSGGFLPDEW
jgi:two-component system LytT family response regulator